MPNRARQSRAKFGVRKLRAGARPGNAAAVVWAIVAAIVPLARAHAAAPVQTEFAQVPPTVTLGPEQAHQLEVYFSPPYQAGPLPPPVARALEASVPEQVRGKCAATVDQWRGEARGSGRITIRILGLSGADVWLAYRCESSVPRYARYYDERLALLTADRRRIVLVDAAAPDDSKSALYHVGFAEALKLKAARAAAAFVIYANGATPYRPDAPAIAEDRTLIVADTPAGVRPVIAIVTERRVQGGEAGKEFHAAVEMERDPAGNVIAITAYSRDQAAREPADRGIARYAWNDASFSFDQVKPVALKPVRRRHPLAN